MYAPLGCGDRDVLLACFDPAHRIALVRPGVPGDGRSLALPAIRRRTGEPYRKAAARLARAMAPAGTLRFGKVTGRIPAAAPCGQARRRAERRLFTAHVSSQDALHAPWGGTRLVWFPRGDASAQLAHLTITDLDLFLQGYVQGWIPDGWITLG